MRVNSLPTSYPPLTVAGSGSVRRFPVMARLDRAIFRGTASGSDGPVKPGHDVENSKLTHYPVANPIAWPGMWKIVPPQGAPTARDGRNNPPVAGFPRSLLLSPEGR